MPIRRTATLTIVPSRKTIPLARTVAASTPRPCRESSGRLPATCILSRRLRPLRSRWVLAVEADSGMGTACRYGDPVTSPAHQRRSTVAGVLSRCSAGADRRRHSCSPSAVPRRCWPPTAPRPGSASGWSRWARTGRARHDGDRADAERAPDRPRRFRLQPGRQRLRGGLQQLQPEHGGGRLRHRLHRRGVRRRRADRGRGRALSARSQRPVRRHGPPGGRRRGCRDARPGPRDSRHWSNPLPTGPAASRARR